MAKTIKVTEDGLLKLKAELEDLKTNGRADIAEKTITSGTKSRFVTSHSFLIISLTLPNEPPIA
jgi:hypothetical protein